MRHLRERLSPALVLSIIAVILAIGGTAFALGKNTVGPAELFVEPKDAERQAAFRTRLPDTGVTTATVTTPAELSEKLFQALMQMPSARSGRRCSPIASLGLGSRRRAPR